MDRDAVFDRLQTLITEQLDDPQVSMTRETELDALGFDSVERVELMGSLEEEFNVVIPPSDAVHLTTVDALIRYLAARS